MTDIYIGAVWTLLAMLVGALITLVLLAVVSDREDPDEDEGPEDEPAGPLDFQFFEAQLLTDDQRVRITDNIIYRWEEDLAKMQEDAT